MITYLLIGLIVQLAIAVERLIRIYGLSEEARDEFGWTFMLLFVIFTLIGAVIWPLQIICEIICIKLDL